MNTHSLKADGAAFSATTLTRVDPNSTKGHGVAICGCGDTSPGLDSRAARKAWHAEHKSEAEPEPVEDEAALDPEDDATVAEVTRVYTGGYAAVLAKAAVARVDEFVNVEAKAKKVGYTRVVTITGPQSQLSEFTAESDGIEADAVEELHAWQKTDPERKAMTNNQRYAHSCKKLAGILAEERHGVQQ